MPGADDCWTDHRLLITKLKLTIKRKPRNIQQNEARRYDTGKLKDPDTSRAFQAAIQQNLPARELSVDAEWTNIRDAINETARTIIGYQSKQHQDWFDDNDKDIEALINTKRKARIAHDQDPNSQPKWLNMHKQSHSVKPGFVKYKMSGGNKWLKTYKVMLTHTAAGTLLAADNTILTEDYEIQNRWVEHFNTLLNRNSSAQQDFLRNVPQHPPQLWMSLPPTFREFDAALKQMRHGKAAGPDNIPTEFLTHGGLVLKTRLHSLILKAWEEKQAPNDWKDALLVTIFKKGDRRECGNYRGISLLSIAGKILARILLNRLQIVAEIILPESQCGFRPSRGTIDMIFCARQLQEKSKEQQKPIFLISTTSAFDSVPRTAMWSVLNRFGVPEPFVDMIKALHDGMTAKVIHQSNLSAPSQSHVD
nr:uncharacterized protein LOC113828287 [Penaeus vannamei]